MFNIRYAGAADAELLADFSRQTFYDTFASANSLANMEMFMQSQFTREMLIEEYQDGKNTTIMAIKEDEIWGYSMLKTGKVKEGLNASNPVELARIYTSREAVGKGVGSALMENSIQWAKNAEYDVIWLGVWEHNQRAIEFYLKWEFVTFGAHVFMLGEDPQTDILMMKPLR